MTSPGPCQDPIVSLEQVGRDFPGPPPVSALRPCSLQIGAGDFVSIVGPSGSGKTTLINLIGLLDRPSTGTYRLEGIDVSSLTDEQRTAVRGRRIGFVFQTFELLNKRSALENVMLGGLYTGASAADRRRTALLSLEQVGLAHRRESQVGLMSGGERQRVAIARALSTSPALLLCDEPTGNLDRATSDAVLELLASLNSDGVTLLLITHDNLVARRADRTVLIEDGSLTEVL